MTGRPRTVDDQAIFDAVSEVISHVGPAGLTFAAVGARVGLSGPALTQRFGSKRGLLLAFARNGEGEVAAAFKQTRRGQSAIKALISSLERFTGGIRTPETLANNLAFLQMDLTDPDLRPLATSQSRELRRCIRALLDDAVTAGELRTVDTDELTRLVYAIYNGALLTWAIDGRGAVRTWVSDHIEAALRPYRP